MFVEGDGLDWNGLKQKLIVPVLTSRLLVAMVTWGQAVFSFHSSNATPAGNEAILTRPRKTAWCRRVDKVGPCLRLMIWLCSFPFRTNAVLFSHQVETKCFQHLSSFWVILVRLLTETQRNYCSIVFWVRDCVSYFNVKCVSYYTVFTLCRLSYI